MDGFFDINGTHIALDAIKDFRTLDVEFIFRPVFREAQKGLLNAFINKKYEFVAMEPYAAIIGQQGHKSALGEYKAKDFKEALGKDITGAVIYTLADKMNLKAFKRQKYQCLNLAGRAFTTYLDDVPAMLRWNDGRIAEVYKEDPLYKELGEITTPGVQYITALVIKANDAYCFYGNGIQVADARQEYERLSQEISVYTANKKSNKLMSAAEKLVITGINSKVL